MPSFLQALWTGGLQGYLLVGFLLFVIGLMTVLLRRSFLLQFMGIELMLNAINIILLAFGKWQGEPPPLRFFIFSLSVLLRVKQLSAWLLLLNFIASRIRPMQTNILR